MLLETELNASEIENVNSQIQTGLNPLQCAETLYRAYLTNTTSAFDYEPGFLYVQEDDKEVLEPDAILLRRTHDLAVLTVFASIRFESTVDLVRNGLYNRFHMSKSDIDAGITHSLDRQTLKIERGGVLKHSLAR